MSSRDRIIDLAKNKKNLLKIAYLLDESMKVLFDLELLSPRHSKKIQKLLEEFDSLLDW